MSNPSKALLLIGGTLFIAGAIIQFGIGVGLISSGVFSIIIVVALES